MAIAERIGTFETSILPYEDCCTIVVPKHPETKPKLEAVVKSERPMEEIAAVSYTHLVKTRTTGVSSPSMPSKIFSGFCGIRPA